jgi:hypothetical protein
VESYFELIDLKSGNVIGGVSSESDALASLQRAFDTNGSQAIQDLSLMRITDEDQPVIAMGEDLEILVGGLARSAR